MSDELSKSYYIAIGCLLLFLLIGWVFYLVYFSDNTVESSNNEFSGTNDAIAFETNSEFDSSVVIGEKVLDIIRTNEKEDDNITVIIKQENTLHCYLNGAEVIDSKSYKHSNMCLDSNGLTGLSHGRDSSSARDKYKSSYIDLKSSYTSEVLIDTNGARTGIYLVKQ